MTSQNNGIPTPKFILYPAFQVSNTDNNFQFQ
jgi:hypothetical protein